MVFRSVSVLRRIPVDDTVQQGIYDSGAPLGGSVCLQRRGVQRKTFPAFSIFQMPAAPNARCTKVAYFGWPILDLCWQTASGLGTSSPEGDKHLHARTETAERW